MLQKGKKKLLDETDEEDKVKGTTAKIKNTAVATASITTQQDDSKDKVNLSPDEITSLRKKSARHYVQCARILAGLIGIMCGKDPSEIAAADSNLENNENKKPRAIEETKDSDVKENLTVQDQASAAINKIRNRISKLNARDTNDNERVHDLREMLDEIQETIDNAEKDKEGLRDLGLMRKKAEEDAKKCDEPEAQPGSITSIGFGKEKPSVADFVTAKKVSLATSSPRGPVTTSSDAVPMMVVKKKKKRDAKSNPQADLKRFKKS